MAAVLGFICVFPLERKQWRPSTALRASEGPAGWTLNINVKINIAEWRRSDVKIRLRRRGSLKRCKHFQNSLEKWFSETPGPTVAASPETAQKLLETLSNRSHSNQINQTLSGGHSSPFQQALQVILMKASLEIRQRLGHFSSVRNGPGILGDAGVLG